MSNEMRAKDKIGWREFTNKICRVKFDHKTRDESGDISHIFNVNRRYLYFVITIADLDVNCRCVQVDVIALSENGEPIWACE